MKEKKKLKKPVEKAVKEVVLHEGGGCGCLKIVLVCLAAILSLAGCGGQSIGGEDGESSVQSMDIADEEPEAAAPLDTEAEMTLSLYCLEEKNLQPNILADTYIAEFNKIYPNITIIKTAFEDRDQFDETIVNELNAGTGPDILMLSSRSRLDMRKLAQNGAFEQLDAYMEAEGESMNTEGYISGALEAGQIGGRQYWMPFTVLVPIVLYQPGDSHAFEPAPVISFDDFQASVLQAMEKAHEDEQRAAIAQQALLITLMSSGIFQYSEEEQTYFYDEGKCKEYVEFIASVERDNKEKAEQISDKYGDSYVSMLQHYTYQFYCPADSVYLTKLMNGINRAVNDSDVGVCALRYGDECVPAFLSNWGVVSSNIGEKGPYAYAFLRTAMDADIPLPYGVYGSTFLSINKQNIQDEITFLQNKFWKYQIEDMDVVDDGLGEKLAEDLMEIVDSIDTVEMDAAAPYSIFTETFSPYFEGVQDYESCMTDFKQRMNLYVTE